VCGWRFFFLEIVFPFFFLLDHFAKMSSDSSPSDVVPAALQMEGDAASSPNGAAMSFPTPEKKLTEEAATMLMKVNVAACYTDSVSASASSSSTHTSGSATAVALKQRQRLLARRHLNLSRRMHPRMSTLEAKMVVCRFNSCFSVISLDEKRLADEAAFWEESVASLQTP
jgi:hypothetical protein